MNLDELMTKLKALGTDEGGMLSKSAIQDLMEQAASFVRPFTSGVAMIGHGFYELFDADGSLKQTGAFSNLITEYGDQFYGDRAAAISAPAVVTGMRLGQGTTAPAKTGAGAAIVTYKTASQVAIDATWPQSSLSGSSRRIQWKTTWGAGVATEVTTALAEVVITNETPITNVAGTAANTISRALLSPTVLKGASDTLAVTWNHDLLGA